MPSTFHSGMLLVSGHIYWWFIFFYFWADRLLLHGTTVAFAALWKKKQFPPRIFNVVPCDEQLHNIANEIHTWQSWWVHMWSAGFFHSHLPFFSFLIPFFYHHNFSFKQSGNTWWKATEGLFLFNFTRFTIWFDTECAFQCRTLGLIISHQMSVSQFRYFKWYWLRRIKSKMEEWYVRWRAKFAQIAVAYSLNFNFLNNHTNRISNSNRNRNMYFINIHLMKCIQRMCVAN